MGAELSARLQSGITAQYGMRAPSIEADYGIRHLGLDCTVV